MPEIEDCEIIEQGITPDCDDLNQVGGINKRIYVGSINDIDTDVLAFTDGAITAFALKVGKTLKLFISDRFKQMGSNEAEVNPNGAPTWKHIVDFVHYFSKQEQINAIEQLCKAKQTFCIIEKNTGKFKAYGICNLVAYGIHNYGLSLETNAGTEGTLNNDDTTDKTKLSGSIPNKPCLFSILATNAEIVEALDGMSLIES